MSKLSVTKSLYHQLLRIRFREDCVLDTLGPGKRAVVWVQGCSVHCNGCMVPETWRHAGGTLHEPAVLANELINKTPDLDGITVSGGEPTEQALAVAEFLTVFRECGKNTWVYSGYTLEQLVKRSDDATDRLLSLTDVLVDGPYMPAEAGAFSWRGSANQHILRLSDRIPADLLTSEGAGRIEVRLDNAGGLVFLGIPPPGFLDTFRSRLEQNGIQLQTQVSWRAASSTRAPTSR